jgi:hypothetical protein
VLSWMCMSLRHPAPPRKRADVPLVLRHQRVWLPSRGEQAEDSGTPDWGPLPPTRGLAPP